MKRSTQREDVTQDSTENVHEN